MSTDRYRKEKRRDDDDDDDDLPRDFERNAGPRIQIDRSLITNAIRDKITEYIAQIAVDASPEEQARLVDDMINMTVEIQEKMILKNKRRKEEIEATREIANQAGFDRLMEINDQQTLQTLQDERTFQAIHALLNRLGPDNENLKRELLRSMVGTLQKMVFEQPDFRDKNPSLRGTFDDFTCALFEQISSSVRNIAATSAAVVTEVSAPLSASAIMIISSVYMGTPKLVTAFALGYLGYQGGTILEQNGRLFQGWQQDGLRNCVSATATVLNGTCSIATGAVVGSANVLKGIVTRIAQAGGSAVYGISDIVTSAVNIYGTINDFECSPGSSPPSSQGSSPRSSNGSSRASNVSISILSSGVVPPETKAAQILNDVLALEQGQVTDPLTGEVFGSQITDDSSDLGMQPMDTDFNDDIDGGRRRGRKSRRYKKKRSTLKRRGLKRRRTRKGKKRRHTKKR
jgi:hypothetical protein